MINEFENSLDSLLASFGIEKVAEVALDLPPTSNVVGSTINSKRSMKQGLQPSSIKPSSLPNGVGSLEGNGNHVTPVMGRMGGMEVTSAYRAIKSYVRDRNVSKLGFKKTAQRLMAFGPSEIFNNEKLLGFTLAAIKAKYASLSKVDLKSKLAADPLVKQFLKLANKSKTAFGPSTWQAINDMISSGTSGSPLGKDLIVGGLVGGGLLAGKPLQDKDHRILHAGKFSVTPDGAGPLNP